MYKETSEKILERMLKNSNGNTSSMEGTLTYDALSPISKELSQLKKQLDDALNKIFAKTAYENGFENELKMKIAEHGIYEKRGEKATSTITIEGIRGTKIPKFTIFQTQLNLQYKTLKDVEITESGIIDVPIEASKEGSEYNVKSNTITEMPIQLIGISKVYNKNDIENGRDTETLESLYNRFLIKVQTPSTSGNTYDYMNWALEVNGVGNVIVKPLWNGNGSVKVILISSNGRCPSKEIIENVKNNIERKRPVCANVTVTGVQEVNLKIECNLLLYKNIDITNVKKQVVENIQQYLKTVSLKSTIVRYNKIANCILNVDEIIDYTQLKINGYNKDIKLQDDSIAILERVVVDSVI